MRLKPCFTCQLRALLMLSLPALLLSVALIGQTPAVVARDAWVRLPLKSQNDAALFMMLENHSAQPRSVVSVSSPASGAAEMHQMHMDKMVMVMLPVTQIAIPANGKTSLDPNGYHIMLFRLKMRPVVGDKIEVTLKLDDGTTVPVEATVRK
jgi:periplasmic copper chaperone A